jgi:uncharacterized surface protein with fasciclin (FAS1) repeats
MKNVSLFLLAITLSICSFAQTVVDIIVNSPTHTTLEAAVIAAELADDLSGAGPFTVFAPTDAAFAALPAGVVDALLLDPTGDLAQILLYHVVSGNVLSTDLSDGQIVTTLQGQTVTIDITGGIVTVNGAQVIVADLLAENGVVHVIDAVLLPNLTEPLPATVVDIIVNSDVHTTLEAAVIAAELADDLSGVGPFTVFAPTDAAFAALPAGVVDALLLDPTGDLAQILLYHVVSGSVLSTDLSDGQIVTTLQGQTVTIDITGGIVTVNGAQVIVADLLAENGVVHVIDAVLLPNLVEPLPATVVDIIVGSDVHTTLEAAVIAAELADDLSGTGPFTVFAPTDAAFAALPAGVVDALLLDPTGDLAQILLYHVVSGSVLSTDLSDGQVVTTLQGQTVTIDITGGIVTVNGAQVIVADLLAENGVVHVIDAVLLPNLEEPLPATVVDIIVNSDVHTTLEAAVIAAELADDLSGVGPFTVFAPTDAAFAALPAGTIDALLADPTGDLAQILLYHVVSGSVLSTDLSDGQIVTTLQGQTVTIDITGGIVTVNGAQVIVADLLAENGVVHVIDAVLLPNLEEPLPATVVDIIVNSDVHTTLEAAVIAAELADDLSGVGPFTVFAPTDAAFAALPAGVVDALLLDPTGDLAQILLYHVVSGSVLSTDLSDGQIVTTLQGQTVTIDITGGIVTVNGAQVIVADLLAENGVVHVIDAVLLPNLVEPLPATVVDIIVGSDVHTTLEAAVIAAELADDLSGTGPFTVFAPTDAAFAALPAGVVDALLLDPTGDLAQILLYHVASGSVLSTDLTDGQVVTTLQGQTVTIDITGGIVTVNGAQVIVADLLAENGVVHVIDAVLLPNLVEPLPATVVDIIVGSDVHTTLEAAVIAAELADDLSGTGPFTVFAPTDAAFAALPAGVVDALLLDPTGDLAQILLYHVVSGSVLSTDLTDGQIVTTLQGQTVTIDITGGIVTVNGAQVIVADLLAENGVVHVIDAVLLPNLEEPLPATVVDIIVNSDVHTTLEAAVIAAELADDLSGAGPFTIFAPTDAAFAALPAGVVDALLLDPTGDLAQILLYHVVSGSVLSTDLSDGQIVTTLQGQTVTIDITGGIVTVNGAQVIVADLLAENGVVHVIDAVLLPNLVEPLPATVVDIIVGSDVHTTLEAAVIAAELADDLSGVGPFTVFAPTDAAFAALPAGVVDALLLDPTGDLAQILLYHVVSGSVLSTDLTDGQIVTTLQGQTVNIDITGGIVTVNGAQVIVADLLAENGVVHVIDAVLLPNLEEPLPATVVDIIVGSDVHTTLEAAVIAAELADDLSGTGPFTVFAPTDAAFAALPAGVVDALLLDPTGDLAQILLYHVVSGSVLSTDLSDGQIVTTLQGQTVNIDITGGIVTVNGAQVIVADLLAENGVVHVIDAVLLPNLVEPLPATVVDIIVGSDVHTTLEAAVIAAELADDLSGTGPFTVFAPTDAAFAALPAGVVDALLLDPTGDLAQILLYHVVSGSVLSTDLSDGQIVTTLQGQTVTIDITGGIVTVNGAQVIVADLLAENGVVHVIDAVLLPNLTEPLPATVVDIIVNSDVHTTLEAAVIAAELADDLSGVGPFTVFAPTDAAFAALPAGVVDALLLDPTGDLAQILLYHVVSGSVLSTDLSDGQIVTTLQGQTVTIDITGGIVTVNGAQVIVADLLAENGVVHVIDAVLLPNLEEPLPATVVDIIVGSDVHTTLEAAVIAAELADDLSGTGPFTVFAPTDAAFAALPAGVVDALLLDPTGDLAQILLYHVVSGSVLSTDLTDGQIVTTLQGQTVNIDITGGIVTVNGAQVIVADLLAENGVVHVIDAVLLPNLEEPLPATVVDIIVGSDVHTTLEAAVIAAELADDLSGTGPFTVFAPTDAAFAALPAGVVDALLLDPTGDLAQILLYHVVSGSVLSTDLSDGQIVTTLQGQTVNIDITGGIVTVNGAQVIVADLLAENGVVHVIDAVLLPEISVEENSGLQFTAYPNPTQDQLTLQLPAGSANASVRIYNGVGQLVSSSVLNAGNQSLDVSNLSQGLYTVEVTINNQVGRISFLKN